MQFSVGTQLAELPGLFSRFVAITGAGVWDRREKDFARQIKDNQLVERYLDIQFPIERTMIDARRYLKRTGRLPSMRNSPSPQLGMLYSFAGVTARVFNRLPQKAQNVLRRRMEGGLKDNIGLAPVAFEMRTAAHFLATGFDVEFSDLCSAGGFDFLVRKAKVEIEVECKSVSGDLGHQIHLLRQYQLGAYLLPAMETASRRGSVQLAVATLPDRLHGQREFMSAVGGRISKTFCECMEFEDYAPCSVNYQKFPIKDSPFDCPSPPQITETQISKYFEKIANREVGHTILMFSPRRSAVLVALRSLKPDRFLVFLYRNLREAAASQFSKTRPGIICVQLRNLTDGQLREIAETPSKTHAPTGIQLMTAKFFDSAERTHVHTVAYTAPGEFASRQSYRWEKGGLIRDTAIAEDAKSYTFINKMNPQSQNSQFRMF
jgi:hypothetical protein